MPRNVLLLTVDSMRADEVSRPHVDLPALESLIDSGVSFERAFATGPGTTPSFPALLTGTMPLSYGGLGPLTADRPRVSSHFRDAGLTTGGFQSNPFLSRHFDYDVGFDTYEDYQNPLMGVATKVFPRGIELNGAALGWLDRHLHITDAIKWVYQTVRSKPRPYVSAEIISDDIIEWFGQTDEPFFGWAHYMDVHQPCYPPKTYREQFDVGSVSQSTASDLYSRSISDPDSLSQREKEIHRSLVDAALAYTDHQIGRILNALREQGLFDDTLVVFTSDHGHLYGDHSRFGKPEMLYDELLNVPLVVVNGPDHIRDAREDLVSLLDVPPLCFDALDLPIPDAFTGRRPGVDEPREYILAEHEVAGAVVVGGRSANWRHEHDEIRDEQRLFRFDTADGPRVDATTVDGDDELTRLKAAVADRLNSLDVDATGYDRVEDDVQNRLAELGYL